MISLSVQRQQRRPRNLPGYLRPMQSYLDRHWPGLILRMNYELGIWVLTDLTYMPSGRLNHWLPVFTAETGRAILGDASLEKPIASFVQRTLMVDGEDVEDNWSFDPCRDRTMAMLHYSFHGNKEQEIDERLRQMDMAEDKEKALGDAEYSDAVRQSAEAAWRRHKGTIMSGNGWVSSPRRIDQDIDRRMRKDAEERSLEEQSEIDAAVREHIEHGHDMPVR